MGFAAVALRYAFPVTVYAQNCATDSRGRTVTMQSISSSLKVLLFYPFVWFNWLTMESVVTIVGPLFCPLGNG